MIKNNPELAKSLLDSSQPLASFESLSSSVNVLKAIKPSNVLETNPNLLQSLLPGTIPSLSNGDVWTPLSSSNPDDMEISPLTSIAATNSASSRPYLGNPSLTELLGSLVNQTI
jgi:hypothetical protein